MKECISIIASQYQVQSWKSLESYINCMQIYYVANALFFYWHCQKLFSKRSKEISFSNPKWNRRMEHSIKVRNTKLVPKNTISNSNLYYYSSINTIHNTRYTRYIFESVANVKFFSILYNYSQLQNVVAPKSKQLNLRSLTFLYRWKFWSCEYISIVLNAWDLSSSAHKNMTYYISYDQKKNSFLNPRRTYTWKIHWFKQEFWTRTQEKTPSQREKLRMEKRGKNH